MFNFTRREPLGVCRGDHRRGTRRCSWRPGSSRPALAAGNTVVIKPSEFTLGVERSSSPSCSSEAGFPPGVVNVVTGFGAEVGDALVEPSRRREDRLHRLASVPASGSTRAAARGLKRVTPRARRQVAQHRVRRCRARRRGRTASISGIFAATGQTCIAGSRAAGAGSASTTGSSSALVAFAKHARRWAIRMRSPTPGRPDHDAAAVPEGPRLHRDRQGRRARSCVLGGRRGDAARVRRRLRSSSRPSSPTSTTAMRIAQEEVFGPVLSVIPFEDEEEAIAIANDVALRPRRRRLDPETCGARSACPSASRPARSGSTPIARSATCRRSAATSAAGSGRESGMEAIEEYLQTKCVWLSTATEVPNPFVLG